jgi:hypothetical protein
MAIDENQRMAYRQALENWKTNVRNAQKVRDRVFSASSSDPNNPYLITGQEIGLLKSESEAFQRLASIAQNM